MPQPHEETKLPLLLTVGGRSQQNLWKPLSEHVQLVFADQPAANHAASMGLRVGLVGNAMTPAMIEHAKARAIWLCDGVLDQLVDKDLALDQAMEHLRSPHLANWLLPMVFDEATQALIRVLAADTFMQDEGRYVAILLHEDVTSEGQAFAQFGRMSGIPVLHIPHANHFIEAGTDDIHCRHSSDFIGAYGLHMAEWYEACGVPPETISLIGGAQWDPLYDPERLLTKEHARRALGLWDDDFIIGYATTWYQDTNVWGSSDDLEWAFQRFMRACVKLGAQPVVKVHPGETDEHVRHYAAAMRAHRLRGTVTSWHSEYAILASDVFIVQGPSNFGVEVSILGRPLMEMFIPSARYPEKYGIPGTWGDDLEDVLQAVRDTTPGRDFVKAMNFGDDGGAAERAAQWIMDRAKLE